MSKRKLIRVLQTPCQAPWKPVVCQKVLFYDVFCLFYLEVIARYIIFAAVKTNPLY